MYLVRIVEGISVTARRGVIQTMHKFVDSIFEDGVLKAANIRDVKGEDGKYTDVEYAAMERGVFKDFDSVRSKNDKALDEAYVGEVIEQLEQSKAEESGREFSLTDEQRQAVLNACGGSNMELIVGRAGTGKTVAAKAIVDAYEGAGYRVMVTSFQGKAVEELSHATGVDGKTVDSFLYSWQYARALRELISTGGVSEEFKK